MDVNACLEEEKKETQKLSFMLNLYCNTKSVREIM